MADVPALPAFPAAERWNTVQAEWAIPPRVLRGVSDCPFTHEPRRFTYDARLDRASISARWAREVLPPAGGTVLDVGCGAGKASLPLVPPASELIGVDRRGAMLDHFVAAASSAGVARRTVHGEWPGIAPSTPSADVVVCHHVVYDVDDILPFLWALTDHARLAVVVELPTVHPMTVWAPAYRHFWDLDRPTGPTHEDLVAVVRELGADPEVTTGRRPARRTDPDRIVDLLPLARRRLCLTEEHDDELARFLLDHPPAWPETMATVRWPGAAEPPI